MFDMTANVRAFDDWIRNRFKVLNTQLEELYFAQAQRAAIEGVGEALKADLLEEGRSHITRLLSEGNTDEGFDKQFDLLGNVGLYMAACRRHELTEPSRETRSPLIEASTLALQLGASLGVTPRFATSHLATHNAAHAGEYKSFTTLADEYLFTEYNARGIFAYKRAADALVQTLPLGISHPVTYHLFQDAHNALLDVVRLNDELFEKLDTDRFFYCVRPYFKPYRVGLHEYRGANAGDFAGINQIDLLLGLCQASDVSYAQLLVDKFLYMLPEDQLRLRDCMRRRSILDLFLDQLESSGSEPWFKRNAAMFLEVCRVHGQTAAQHHDRLVSKFIAKPAEALPPERTKGLTASGPPLDVLLLALEKLRDLRLAADRADILSRYHDLRRLAANADAP